jgi:hypothetical protein
MGSPLASAFLPLLVLFPAYITLNLTFLGDYETSWLLLSLAGGMFPSTLTDSGMWFTYALMQIFFGGFGTLDKPKEPEVDPVEVNAKLSKKS